ncbi:MAG: cobalamin-dependent protein [bacterium]
MEREGARRIRVLLAKAGLDGHDRGVKVIAHTLRDAGMEVIYTGLRQSAGQIAAAALQEGVDVIGLSVLSGAYMGIARKLMGRLREEGLEDVLVIFGGNILDRHVEDLKALGVSAVFNHHADLDAIVRYIRENAPEPAAG